MLLLAAVVAAPIGLTGCKSKQASPPLEQVRRPAPKFEDVATVVNTRVKDLQRVWARAVTSFTYTDGEGSKRTEQGEGFFQLLQPSRFALDIGKVGEVIVWAGCDDKRYWLIRRDDVKSAVVGRHDGAGSERLLEEGLPATPLNLIDLAGVTGVTVPKPGTLIPLVGWTMDGFWTLEEPRPYGTLYREIDPRTGEPRRVVMKSGGRERVASELRNHVFMELANTSDWPRMPTRITITDLDTGNTITIGLEGMSDGIRGRRPGNERLKPAVFDFEGLCAALGVEKIEDLDAAVVPARRERVGGEGSGGRVVPPAVPASAGDGRR
jgi:hypothetical protein